MKHLLTLLLLALGLASAQVPGSSTLAGANLMGPRQQSPFRPFYPIHPNATLAAGMSYSDVDVSTFSANTTVLYQLAPVDYPITVDGVTTVWKSNPGGTSKSGSLIIYVCDPLTYVPTGVISAQTQTAVTDGGGAITSAVKTAVSPGQWIINPTAAAGNHFGYVTLNTAAVITLQPGVYLVGQAWPKSMTGILAEQGTSVGLMTTTIDSTSTNLIGSTFSFPAAASVPTGRTADMFTTQISDAISYFHCVRN